MRQLSTPNESGGVVYTTAQSFSDGYMQVARPV